MRGTLQYSAISTPPLRRCLKRYIFYTASGAARRSTISTSSRPRPCGWTTTYCASRPGPQKRNASWSSAGSPIGTGLRSSAIAKRRSGSSRSVDHAPGRCRRMKASEFDRKFAEGVEDVIDDLDMATATRPLKERRRVNVDFPSWMVESLDREARRLGVTRQSIIKVWIAERLEKAS